MERQRRVDGAAPLHAAADRACAPSTRTFRRATFLRGQELPDDGPLPDVWWFRPDGRKMTSRDWEHGEAVLGMFLNGDAIPTPGRHGERITDDSFVLLFNAHGEDREFVLPRKRMGTRWELELCTEDIEAAAGSRSYGARDRIADPASLDHDPASASSRCDRCAPPTGCS